MPTDPLDVPPGSLTLEAITDLLDGGSAPAGATGDLQFNSGGGTFADADALSSGALASLDSSGNLTIASISGNLSFTAATKNINFSANDEYIAGATKIIFNAGGDTTLVLDSSVNPETIVLDSDLSNTLIKVAPSAGQIVSIGNATGFKLGFFGATPALKPTITGAKGGNTALAGTIAALVALGLVTDSTT